MGCGDFWVRGEGIGVAGRGWRENLEVGLFAELGFTLGFTLGEEFSRRGLFWVV